MPTEPKEIIFEEEARNHLLEGIEKLTEIVSFTYGPKGRNIGVEKSYGPPSITNDGGSIVEEVEVKDPFTNMGVSMGKQVVQKIKEKCGDGTTTGLVLLRELTRNGVKNIASGASPISLKRGMDKGLECILEALSKQSKPVKKNSEILNIATVSASGNEEVGKFIAEAMEKVKDSGVITIEEAKGTETSIEVVEGMRFDRGYISAYFCTNADKMEVEMDRPQILLVDKKIGNVHEILPLLQNAASTGRQLLIIAEDIESDALSTLVVNKLRGTLKVAAVKAPGFGDRRKEMLKDIAILTGGTLISEEIGMSLKETKQEDLGTAAKVIITKDATTIIDGAGERKEIASRITEIEGQIAKCDSTYDKEKLEERKAKLSGGVALIRVGAATEPELKQKKQLFQDSLLSTKAAQEEGVVTGGGVALLQASKSLDTLKLEGDESIGLEILRGACRAPLKQIATNAGVEGSVILSEVEKGNSPTLGFNAETGKIEDLFEAGIVDPTKMVKNSLTHAVSIAGIVLLSEALISEVPEEKKTA